MTAPGYSSLVLIDTSAWICHFDRKGYHGLKALISTLLENNLVAISGPVVVELTQGCRSQREKAKISRCIKGLHWLPVTDDSWYKAADLAFHLRRKGVTTSVVDTLIAAVAIENNCFIIHKDSDYSLIARHTALKLYPPVI